MDSDQELVNKQLSFSNRGSCEQLAAAMQWKPGLDADREATANTNSEESSGDSLAGRGQEKAMVLSALLYIYNSQLYMYTPPS